MFEAYKVGITIALTNQVSRGLFLIQGDLVKTDAAALRLKTTLSQIKLLGVGGALLGGAGYAGLHALGKTLDAAKEYQQALAQFKSLNLGDAVNAQADRFARGASVIGASATDLMRTTRDLTTVLGDFGLAKQLSPGFAQLKYANQAVYGGKGLDFNENQLRSLERIIEMKGGWKGPQDFLSQASMMQQVIAGTGGMVKPNDYLAFIKTAGVAGRLLSNQSFYYGMEPLIQEMGGNRVGTALMSAYNNLGQGRSSVRAARELMRLGLVNPSMVEYDKIGQIKQIRPGALTGMSQFAENPFAWMQQVLLPAMKARGITSEQGILNEMGVLFGNRTASSLFSLMFTQQEKILKNMKLSQGAMGTDDLVRLARSSPQGAEMALSAAWNNLKIATGNALIPVIIPALNKLAEAIRVIGQEIYRHPTMFKALILGFAGLSSALLFSGAVLTLKAAFTGLALVVGVAGGANGIIGSIGAFTAALGPLGVAIAGIVGLLSVFGKERMAKLGQGVDWLGGQYNPLSLLQSGIEGGVNAFRAPPSGKNVTVNTQINMDGRKVAEGVSSHQADSASAPFTSVSGYSPRLSPMWGGF